MTYVFPSCLRRSIVAGHVPSASHRLEAGTGHGPETPVPGRLAMLFEKTVRDEDRRALEEVGRPALPSFASRMNRHKLLIPRGDGQA